MIILHCKMHTLGFNGNVLCSKTDKHKNPMMPLKVIASYFQNIFNDSKWWRYWCGFDLWVGKIPLRRKWQPTPIFLLGRSHGQRNLVGCSPWGHKELDATEVTWQQQRWSIRPRCLSSEIQIGLPNIKEYRYTPGHSSPWFAISSWEGDLMRWELYSCD